MISTGATCPRPMTAIRFANICGASSPNSRCKPNCGATAASSTEARIWFRKPRANSLRSRVKWTGEETNALFHRHGLGGKTWEIPHSPDRF